MKYSTSIKFIDTYSYDRYDNFDDLETRSRFYPLQVPMRNETETYPCSELSAGNEAEKFLAELAYYTQGILRCEPQNPYFYHAAVPSARGIHPCDCYYLVYSGKWIVLRYSKLSNSFEFCRECRDEEFPFMPDQKRAYILIAADIWRLAAFYGAFSYVLSMIDAGHIIAQQMLIAEKYGCCAERCDTVCTEGYGKLFGIDISELIPAAMLSIELPGSLEGAFSIPEGNSECERALSYSEDVARFSLLNEVRRKVNEACCEKGTVFTPCAKAGIMSSGVPEADIYSLFRKRSSGQSSIGTFSMDTRISAEDMIRIADDIRSTVSTFGSDIMTGVTLFVNDSLTDSIDLSGREDIHLFSETEPEKFIHDSHSMLDIASMPFIAVTTFELEKYMGKYGDLAVSRIYSDAGIVMQAVSLCLTKEGLFTRPLKNINERYIESLPFMAEGGRVSYMLIAGSENVYSIKIPFSKI